MTVVFTGQRHGCYGDRLRVIITEYTLKCVTISACQCFYSCVFYLETKDTYLEERSIVFMYIYTLQKLVFIYKHCLVFI